MDISMEDLVQSVKAALKDFSPERAPKKRKQTQSSYFKRTEELLYAYPKLKQEIAALTDCFDTDRRRQSSPGHASVATTGSEEMLTRRYAQYDRARAGLDWIEQALRLVQNEAGYNVIEMRYLGGPSPNTGRPPAWEDIAEALQIGEHRVRRYRNRLVNEIALYIFGTDAIIKA